ncbi:hypothetical protein N9L89_00345 [Gammaproteobacteria bacterium]|nr:hypothetical protein [Gammaproteobacteria bacterium]
MQLILILLLSLITAPLFAQVDGKGIYCDFDTASDVTKISVYAGGKLHGIDSKKIKIGFFFSEGKVFGIFPYIEEDIAFFSKGSRGFEYKTNADYITWDDSTSLSRKTLLLTDDNIGKIQCEVFASQFLFDKETDRLRELIQNEYENRLTGNKI